MRTAVGVADGERRFSFIDYRFVKGEKEETFVYHHQCCAYQEVKDLEEVIAFMTEHECHE